MTQLLVQQLRTLMATDFTVTAPRGHSLDTVDLGKADLPAHILEMVDTISDTARDTFGVKLIPSLQEQFVMCHCGFPVIMAQRGAVGWKRAYIVTPKGRIEYY